MGKYGILYIPGYVPGNILGFPGGETYIGELVKLTFSVVNQVD